MQYCARKTDTNNNFFMKRLFKYRFVREVARGVALTLGFAVPALALAASFNTAPADLATLAVLNATVNPNSDTAWAPSVSARAGDLISVEIYYHNAGSDAAQNTILRMSQPTGPQTSFTIQGGVSSQNSNASNGSVTVTFSDGLPHTLTYAGTLRWFPDQPSIYSDTPRQLINGQSGTELFGSGLMVGTVPTDNPNAAPGQAWAYSQGTLDVDFIVGPAPAQASLAVTTSPATNVTMNAATLNGSVIPSSNVTNVTRWFLWGQSSNPTTPTQTQFGQGGYSSLLTGLTPGATYYFRAVGSSNETGTVEGNVLSFTTQGIQAVCISQVITNQPSNITQTSATFSGSVTPTPTNGYLSWFEVSTNQNFTTLVTRTTERITSGATFTDGVSGLGQGMTYYVRAAIRSTDTACPQGVIYGGPVPFQTMQVAQAQLSTNTQPATNITQNSATLNGSVTGSNVNNVTRWFIWGPNANLTNQTGPQSGQGNYADGITGLTPGATYYFQALGRSNETGVVPGTVLSFQTPGIQATCPAQVFTNAPTGITQTSASFSATVTPVPSSAYTSWFEVSLNPGFTSLVAQTSQQAGSGSSFSGYTANLQPGTTYYVRGVVRSLDTNCGQATILGNPAQFQTLAQYVPPYIPPYVPPYIPPYIPPQAQLSVTTNPATNVGTTAATLNGFANASNANNVTRWFEWGSTYSLGQRTVEQYSAGTMVQDVYGLTPNTTYYFRAVARSNETGTVYGNILTFQTIGQTIVAQAPQPTVYTNPATNVTTSSARLNANAIMNNVRSNGWFEYGTTPALGRITSQLDLGASSSNTYFNTITGLTPRTLYYFRAVTRNALGQMAQGQILSFTTLAPSVVYVPPAPAPTPTVTVAAASYTKVTSGPVISKTVENLSFPCGKTTTYVCAREGHTVQYTITVMNPSWSATSNAVITDTLSPFLDFKGASEDANYNAATRVVQWSRQLQPREGHTYTIQVLARAIANNITVKNNAQIFIGGKTYTSNDTEVCITLDPIKVVINSDKTTVMAGDTVTHTIIYTNVVDTAVQNLVLRMPIPQGTTLAGSDRPNLQVDNGVIVIPLGMVNPKQSGTVAISFKVNPNITQSEPIVFGVSALFQDMLGTPQPEEQFYTNIPVGKTSTSLNSANVAAAGVASGTTNTILPTSLLGWLAILLLVLIIILIALRLYSDYTAGRKAPPSTVGH